MRYRTKSGQYPFEVIMRRHFRLSMMTSNSLAHDRLAEIRLRQGAGVNRDSASAQLGCSRRSPAPVN